MTAPSPTPMWRAFFSTPSPAAAGDYSRRLERVPECIRITPANISSLLAWLPGTCAYRLLHEGRDLPDWHPLVSGDPDSVHRAGVSLSNRVVSEADVADEDLPDHVIDWPV